MLVVTASALDPGAAALLPHFRRLDARLLTPADLSQPGWRLDTTHPGEGSVVVSGQCVRVSEIDGVLSLLPAVFPQELAAIEESARTYAAQEMTAFLRYFLTSLRCPVLNQATAGSLCGPLWRPERWLQAAASCRLATDAWNRCCEATDDACARAGSDELMTVTLIGSRLLDDADDDLHTRMQALARTASVGMLTARFRGTPSGPLFCAADACPRLSDERAAHLVEEYFITRGVLA